MEATLFRAATVELTDEATYILPFSLGGGPLLPNLLPTFLSVATDQSERVSGSRDSTLHAGTAPCPQ